MENITPEEIDEIVKVLRKDEEIEKSQMEIIIKKKLELDKIKFHAVIHDEDDNSPENTKILSNRALCFYCSMSLKPIVSLFKSLSRCPYCNHYACYNCTIIDRQTGFSLCIYCFNLKQLERISNAWFFKNTTNNDLGQIISGTIFLKTQLKKWLEPRKYFEVERAEHFNDILKENQIDLIELKSVYIIRKMEPHYSNKFDKSLAIGFLNSYKPYERINLSNRLESNQKTLIESKTDSKNLLREANTILKNNSNEEKKYGNFKNQYDLNKYVFDIESYTSNILSTKHKSNGGTDIEEIDLQEFNILKKENNSQRVIIDDTNKINKNESKKKLSKSESKRKLNKNENEQFKTKNENEQIKTKYQNEQLIIKNNEQILNKNENEQILTKNENEQIITKNNKQNQTKNENDQYKTKNDSEQILSKNDSEQILSKNNDQYKTKNDSEQILSKNENEQNKTKNEKEQILTKNKSIIKNEILQKNINNDDLSYNEIKTSTKKSIIDPTINIDEKSSLKSTKNITKRIKTNLLQNSVKILLLFNDKSNNLTIQIIELNLVTLSQTKLIYLRAIINYKNEIIKLVETDKGFYLSLSWKKTFQFDIKLKEINNYSITFELYEKNDIIGGVFVNLDHFKHYLIPNKDFEKELIMFPREPGKTSNDSINIYLSLNSISLGNGKGTLTLFIDKITLKRPNKDEKFVLIVKLTENKFKSKKKFKITNNEEYVLLINQTKNFKINNIETINCLEMIIKLCTEKESLFKKLETYAEVKLSKYSYYWVSLLKYTTIDYKIALL